MPLPDQDEREHFARWLAGRPEELARLTDFTPPQLAAVSNGLTLLNLQVLLAQGKRSASASMPRRFRLLKKDMIERQCRGLLEFVEPKHTLDLVVGQQAAKDRLKQDAALLSEGVLDAAPMGYLLCGPVGTGKTFLAECYAGSVGVPCVTLRNFRSKYVGETEGNLEQVLTVLRSLGPVVVIIDEADAALGSREADGDAGTSSRVFSMIAAQMGDTRYRGRIVWMLLTSRPDLLPIDLKRQGRAEVHIPLFYPQDEAEVREMFRVMAKKNKVRLPRGRRSAGQGGAPPERLGRREHRDRPPGGGLWPRGEPRSRRATWTRRSATSSRRRRGWRRRCRSWPRCWSVRSCSSCRRTGGPGRRGRRADATARAIGRAAPAAASRVAYG